MPLVVVGIRGNTQPEPVWWADWLHTLAGDETMQYTMMQLVREADGSFTCHVTRRGDDRDAAPRIRSHRKLTAESVCRFFELSGGYFTTYSEKPPRREHELPY